MAKKTMVQWLCRCIRICTGCKVLSPEFIAPLFNIKESVNDGFSKMDNSNVFIGIIIGLIAAYCYNKFSDVELPKRYHSLVVSD